jgi:hypothetical protein
MSNLRVLRHAIKELSRVVAAAESKLDDLGEAQQILLGGLFLGLLESRRDPKTNEAVAKVFSHHGLSEVAQAQLAGVSVPEEEFAAAEDGVFVSNLIGRYSSYEFSLFPGGDVFASFFNTGAIDVEKMFESFAPITEVQSRRELLLKNYLELPQAEFDEEVQLLSGDLRRSSITSMGLIARIYLALRFIARRGAIASTEEEVKDLVIASIKGVDAASVSDFDSDGDDFWFIERKDDLDNEVLSAIESKREEARALNTESERLAVFSDLDREPALATRLQQWKLRPLFIGDAARIVAAIYLLNPAQLQDLMRLFGSRRSFSGFGRNLRDEERTLEEIVAIINARLPKEGIYTIQQSQLKQLSEVMHSFAEELAAFSS